MKWDIPKDDSKLIVLTSTFGGRQGFDEVGDRVALLLVFLESSGIPDNLCRLDPLASLYSPSVNSPNKF
jgi:hypothetical protein